MAVFINDLLIKTEKFGILEGFGGRRGKLNWTPPLPLGKFHHFGKMTSEGWIFDMSRFFEIKALLRNTELPADISIKKNKN